MEYYDDNVDLRVISTTKLITEAYFVHPLLIDRESDLRLFHGLCPVFI